MRIRAHHIALPALVFVSVVACTPAAPAPLHPLKSESPAPSLSATPHAPASASASASASAGPAKENALERIRTDAKAAAALCRSGFAREFLAAAAALPSIATRRLYHDADKTRFFTEEGAKALSEDERRPLLARDIDEEFYYNTNYGPPLAYSRALDILALDEGWASGKKVIDFGYGGVGHLRMLASLGADVKGVEVDPLLRALYSYAGDQGVIKGTRGQDGRIELLHGRFPADEPVSRAAGGGYDLFISKNVLKRGYIHPEQPVKERHRIALGVEDEVFVRTVFERLKPGGRFFIYNLTPAPNAPGKPYVSWADGRCPFPKETLEAAGFRVIAYDKDDTAAARAMGHALGWDRGEDAMDLERDLFGQYMLAERPASP